MTVFPHTTTAHPDLAASPAADMSVLGYALFALLQPGPLSALAPMPEFLAAHEPAPAPAPEPASPAPTQADDHLDSPTGHTQESPHLAEHQVAAASGAPTVSTPNLAGLGLTFGQSSTRRDTDAAAPDPDASAVAPDPSGPEYSPQDYEPVTDEAPEKPRQGLAMLNEINFLDE